MDKPNISLCMIVKNEEEYLPKCLRSVQCIVDEIIIVDTGSTDDTVVVAKSFGAKVIQIPWQDSFADARNRSLEEATGDWILWLDADEEMNADEAGKLKDLLTLDAICEHQVEGIQLVFYNYTEKGMLPVPLHRMVRNRPQYRFEGRIHEEILPSMLKFNPNLQIAQVDIHIYHYGYLPQNVARQSKMGRNTALLQQAMVEHPDDPIYVYHFGLELFRAGDFEGALSTFNTFLNKSVLCPKPIVANAHKYRLMALAELGYYHDLIRDSSESIALFPRYTDLYPLRAIGYSSTGDIGTAIHSYREALRIGPARLEYMSTEGQGTFLTCLDLGILYNLVGNLQESDLYYTLGSLMLSDARIRFQELL